MENTKENSTETKFNSPLPTILRLRNLIFGKETPDFYTQATFFLNIILWFMLTLWSVASYFAISYRTLIFEQKKIPVAQIIKARGETLGFQPDDFLNRLLTFHSISIVCWGIVFIGIVLLWRKKVQFVYFFFGGSIFYFGMNLFYLNFDYFLQDTTFFDKVAFLALVSNTLIYALLLNKEKKGGSLNFFGADLEEE